MFLACVINHFEIITGNVTHQILKSVVQVKKNQNLHFGLITMKIPQKDKKKITGPQGINMEGNVAYMSM